MASTCLPAIGIVLCRLLALLLLALLLRFLALALALALASLCRLRLIRLLFDDNGLAATRAARSRRLCGLRRRLCLPNRRVLLLALPLRLRL